ncbi:hypothetical protein M0813_18508 [Anaeramoeba flamelloides]|uniref:Uncharacterized protein n=1 Tax=Anaeramoeba flamelloides TaxID=1746091 RepID=A0ABQ8YTE8_9EUKA|nr:hypothetical protein M0813_18508 [Anaeramoeba flamelloides]
MSKKCNRCKKRGYYFIKTLEIKTHSRFFYPIVKYVPLNIEVLCYKCVDQLSGVIQQQVILSQYVTFSFVFYFKNTRRLYEEEDSSSENKTKHEKRNFWDKKQETQSKSHLLIPNKAVPKNSLTFSSLPQEPKGTKQETNPILFKNEIPNQQTQNQAIKNPNNFLGRNYNNLPNQFSNQTKEKELGQWHEQTQGQEQKQKQIPFYDPINWGMDVNLGLSLDFDTALDTDLNFGFETETEFNEINLFNTQDDSIINFSNFLQSKENNLQEKEEMQSNHQQNQIQEEK